MTLEKTVRGSADGNVRQFLFGDRYSPVTKIDIAIILLLAVFLFSAPLSMAAMNIGYGAATLLWIGRMVWKRRNDIPRTPLDKFLLAYVAAELLATAFAYNKEQSLLYAYRRVTLLPMIFVMLGNIRSRQVLKILLGTLLTSMVLVALWSMRDLILHFHQYLLFERRSREFQMYMTAGGMMMMGMILVIPFVVHPKTPPMVRWIALASVAPLAVNLLFTFTRSSWLGFLAGAFVIGAFRAKKVFVPVAFLVVIAVLVSSPEMKERMSSIVNPYHPTNIPRLHMWETGIKIFKDHPILGVGDIGIEQVWPMYSAPEWESQGHLHNNLIMWLVTLGIVGFLVLVSLFVKTWVVMRKIEKRLHGDWFLGSVALGGLAVLAGFHVNGLFEWNFGDAEIIMVVWAIVGMTLAAEKVAREEETLG